MLTLEKINRNLLNVDVDDLKDNFVAIAIQINEKGVGYHSGLIIGVNQEYSLFHYTGKDVQINTPPEPNQWVFCKQLEIIDEVFSEGFLAHCQTILENSNPSYGFLFEGSYWKDGTYFSEAGISEITTCVGFCLSVISGYIWHEDYYFSLNDWDINSTEEFRLKYGDFFDRTLNELKNTYPEKFNDLVINHVKRITPAEFTASAYLDNIPIRKSEVDTILENVTTAIKNKRVNNA